MKDEPNAPQVTNLYIDREPYKFKQTATVKNVGPGKVYIRAQSVNIELKPGETMPLSHDFYIQAGHRYSDIEIIE